MRFSCVARSGLRKDLPCDSLGGMVWAIVIALLVVFVGLPLAVTLLFSRGFWLAVFLFGCASVLVYSCANYTPPPPRPAPLRKIPRAELDARYQEWERRHAPAAPAPSP